MIYSHTNSKAFADLFFSVESDTLIRHLYIAKVMILVYPKCSVSSNTIVKARNKIHLMFYINNLCYPNINI